MARTILLIEDDGRTRAVLEAALAAAGYRVLGADLMAAGLHLFRKERPDLVILDLGLPDGSGLDACRKIREHPERGATPVIILTAQAEFETKAEGFLAGADQYLVKPVSPEEVRLWVEALLRRLAYDHGEGDVLKAGDCEIDVKSHIVRFRDAVIPDLRVKEFELLYLLVKRRPQVLSRKQILASLWHTIVVDHVVDSHLTNLRKKIPRELADKIQTIPGKGFRFLE